MYIELDHGFQSEKINSKIPYFKRVILYCETYVEVELLLKYSMTKRN